MIRQQPITTEAEFFEILSYLNGKESDNPDTLYIQWHPDYTKNQNWPEVELLENFLWIHTDPNDSWYYIENNEARAWKIFPNLDERKMPWQKRENNDT